MRVLLLAALLALAAGAAAHSRHHHRDSHAWLSAYGYYGGHCGSYGSYCGGHHGHGGHGHGPGGHHGNNHNHGPPPKHPHTDEPPARDPPAPACGPERLDLALEYTEWDEAAFTEGVTQFVQGLAELCDVLAECIDVHHSAPPPTDKRRRSLLYAQIEQLLLIQIKTDDAANLAIWLQNHMDELRGLLRLLGGRIGAASFAVYGADGHLVDTIALPGLASVGSQSLEPEAIPAQLEAPAPAPTAVPVAAGVAGEGKKKKDLGAILGGAIGGGLGGILLAAVAYYLIRRKRRASVGAGVGVGVAGGLRGAFAKAGNPTYEAPAGATVTLQTAGSGAKGGAFQLEEIVEASGTPRSTRRRKATPFQEDGENAAQ